MDPSEAAGSKCTVDDEITERVAAGGPLGMLDLDERLRGLKGYGICGDLRRGLLLLEGLETLVLVIVVVLVVWHHVAGNVEDGVGCRMG